MQKIYLIRHGITSQNQHRRYCGLSNDQLSVQGQRQAELTAKHLSSEKITSIYTSPLARAFKTAQEISKFHNISPKKLDGLREIDFGLWEGLTFDDIKLNYPDQLEEWHQSPDSFTFPGGESITELRHRVLASLDIILTQDNCLVVAHGGSLRIIISHLCRWGIENLHSFELDPASITILNNYDQSTAVKVLNETCHLNDGDLV